MREPQKKEWLEQEALKSLAKNEIEEIVAGQGLGQFRFKVWTMAEAIEKGDREDAERLAWAKAHLEISPVIEQFGTWAVTEYGVECLTRSYEIEASRLRDEDWPIHLADRPWVSMYDFLEAFYAARRHFFPKQYPEWYPYPKCRPKQTTDKRARNRKNIPLRTRYQVFENDSFRCQICGRAAVDGVVLEVDHVIPVAGGGSDDIDNLQTTCFDCNRGKGDG